MKKKSNLISVTGLMRFIAGYLRYVGQLTFWATL